MSSTASGFEKMFRVGVDIGGTFTDVVCLDVDSGEFSATKVLTTVEDPTRGIKLGLEQILPSMGVIGHFVHGTTVGLNALLERRGARVALITTKGFRDVYQIGRASRPDIYNLFYAPPKPLVDRMDTFEVKERLAADGSVLVQLDELELEHLAVAIRERGEFEAVAVAFLHSYKNATHERKAMELFRRYTPEIPVVISSDVRPVWREFERTQTAVASAYVAPPLNAYITRLAEQLNDGGFVGDICVMQNNGGFVTAADAAKDPLRTLLSGPVGGVMGALSVLSETDYSVAVAVDMGGTSFDVTLIKDGVPDFAQEMRIGDQALLLPGINVKSIGAGGGSIVWLDGDALRVGPRSAGSVPGPISYDRGGVEPTVTDANLVLGRLDGEQFLGGKMHLDSEAARQGLNEVAQRLAIPLERLAEGVVEIVNLEMANAIRSITAEQGIDTREVECLIAYGGAGPLHAVALAIELGIRTVIVPRDAGSFSAVGMLESDLRRDHVSSFFRPLLELDFEEFETEVSELTGKLLVETAVPQEFSASQQNFEVSLDVRYAGQEYSLTVPLLSMRRGEALGYNHENLAPSVRQAFEASYLQAYGHILGDHPVEIVNLRVSLSIGANASGRRTAATEQLMDGVPIPLSTGRTRSVMMNGEWVKAVVADWSAPELVAPVPGPLVVDSAGSTVLIPAGWVACVKRSGVMVLRSADVYA